MRRIFMIFRLLTISTVLYSQQGVKVGGAISYGIGGIKNIGQVQDYFNAQIAQDPTILNYTFTNKTGSLIGLRFDINCYTSPNFSINTGLQYYTQTNDFIIDYKQLTNTSDGSYDLIHSTAIANVQSLSIPLLIKYAFGNGNLRPFINAGLDAEFRISKNLNINSENFTHWDGSAQIYTYQTGTSFNKTLEGYSMIGSNLIIGAGADYKLNEHIIYFSVSYRMGLLNSSLSVNDIYGGTSSGGFSAEVNKVFNTDKQKDILGNYGININDWKNSAILFTFGFLF